MNARYVVMRLIRKVMPEPLYQFMLNRQIVIKPGLETTDPAAAVGRYRAELARHGRALDGARVLDFGYGGHLGTAAALLEAGAAHVYALDKYARLDHARNAALLQRYGKYLVEYDETVLLKPEYGTLIHQDLGAYTAQAGPFAADVVLSSSVFEHIQRSEIDATTASLRAITAPEGIHLHYIDLRDHYFAYPFAMLAYSEAVWRRFFNPSVNLNRLRVPDYLTLFETHFSRVEWTATEQNRERFREVQARIRPEFLTGDEAIDSVLQILVTAWP